MPLRCVGLSLPLFVVFLAALASGCTRNEPRREDTLSIGVDVRADSAGIVLEIEPPPAARIWVARVAPVRPSAGSLELAPPDVLSDSTVIEFPPAPHLLIDDDLKPPISRKPPVLVVPASHARLRTVASVELDVRVDGDGSVSDALWAGGSSDPDLVQAATACALTMTFYPALQGGKPVPVWCRQRFDFGGVTKTR